MTVLVGKGIITLDGICKAQDCKDVWSRINLIEITKNDVPDSPAGDTAAVPNKLGCGNAYAGEACEIGK